MRIARFSSRVSSRAKPSPPASRLEEKLYAPGDEPESNAVEYLIHSLRKKIGASAIENIRGLGWRVPADKNAAQ